MEQVKVKIKKSAMEVLADQVTEALGSTWSLIIHTLIFIGVFAGLLLGISLQTILLFITTIVSFEAIYLAIFIQRSANKQAKRLDRAIAEIRARTIGSSKRPIDEVTEEIDALVKRIERALNSKSSPGLNPSSGSD